MPNPGTLEVQAGGSGVQGQPLVHSKFENQPGLKKKVIILRMTKIVDTWFPPVSSGTWEAETGGSLL